VAFEGDEAFELMMDIGTFHWNLFRALSVIWCRLAFLAAVGLMASTFLSFPVACMGCFLVLLISSSAGFLSEAISQVTPESWQSDPLWFFGPVLRPLSKAFVWLLPDFSQYDAAGNVVGGRLVPLYWVIWSAVTLLAMKGMVIAAAGSLILTKRELAQPTS
jgi:hypothetical protein